MWKEVLIFLCTRNICCLTSVLFPRISLQISQTLPQFICKWFVRLDLEGQWIPQRWQMNSVSSFTNVPSTFSSNSLIFFSFFTLPLLVLAGLCSKTRSNTVGSEMILHLSLVNGELISIVEIGIGYHNSQWLVWCAIMDLTYHLSWWLFCWEFLVY